MNMQLKDLKCYDEMYYVGHLVDMDNDGWVDEQTAIEILKTLNNQSYEQ
jgi:hypothetical protein